MIYIINDSSRRPIGAERDFYETIAGEERGHKLILLDYYEYLHDTAAWFV